MKSFSEIKVQLPDHLVEWLLKFAKQTARTPDKLLAYILEQYYQIRRMGYDVGREESNVSRKVEVFVNNFVKYFEQKNLA